MGLAEGLIPNEKVSRLSISHGLNVPIQHCAPYSSPGVANDFFVSIPRYPGATRCYQSLLHHPHYIPSSNADLQQLPELQSYWFLLCLRVRTLCPCLYLLFQL